MNISSVEVVSIHRPAATAQATEAKRKSWAHNDEVANPVSKFPRFKRHRSLYQARRWPEFGVKITAEDGTWGLGTSQGRAAAAIVEDAFAHVLVGEPCMATDRLWDLMTCVSKPFGTAGIASLAISAVDLALWDLAGKIQNRPVYELLGGPARDRIFCYATGNDVDWYQELGFRAFKLACPHGPADGLEGMKKNEAHVAKARQLIGDDAELMLDCYMAFDVDYTVQLAERLRPYRLKWIEEYLIPEDEDGHAEVRRRLPWMTLAAGEHFYTPVPYRRMLDRGSLDILQPDIHWVGGLTACVRIARLAEAAGKQVCLHGGGRDPYGQHFTWATSNAPWGEYFIGSDPGVPLAEAGEVSIYSGRSAEARVPVDGWLESLPEGAGFGLGIEEHWLQPFKF
jgi:L-rhamnonate dehydratase